MGLVLLVEAIEQQPAWSPDRCLSGTARSRIGALAARSTVPW